MKKLCLLLLFALFSVAAFSQFEKGYVYLKNGTILKGKYKYSSDLNKLQVETAGNLWVFDSGEIDSITTLRAHQKNKIEIINSNTPVYYRTEIGVLAGNSENSQSAPMSFTASGNYKVLPTFSAGVGLGVEFLKESYLPVFANFEFKLRDSYATPYLFVKAGYQVPLESSNAVYTNYYTMYSSFWPGPDYQNESLKAKGGLLINPGIGYQRMFSTTFGMSFAFGYQFHRLHYTGENDYGLDIDYNRLTIKLGIIFN